MNYNEIKEGNGTGIVVKIFGYLFLILGIIMLIDTLTSYFSWTMKEKNYNKQYVYSDSGNLYYEMNDKQILVKKIYDTNEEIIELEIPNKKTVIMYCSKNNIDECIYFDVNNSVDQNMLEPFLGFFVTFILLFMGIISISNNKIRAYVTIVFLFVVGIMSIIEELCDGIKYYNLKDKNNTTVATIYSEIYDIEVGDSTYLPISYYYIDNQKYIFVNDFYIEGTLENDLGKTFELYYNENDPNEVLKKENPIDWYTIGGGIFLIAISVVGSIGILNNKFNR